MDELEFIVRLDQPFAFDECENAATAHSGPDESPCQLRMPIFLRDNLARILARHILFGNEQHSPEGNTRRVSISACGYQK